MFGHFSSAFGYFFVMFGHFFVDFGQLDIFWNLGNKKNPQDLVLGDFFYYSNVILSTVSRSNRLMTSTMSLTAFS
jgi:hypothetical protein